MTFWTIFAAVIAGSFVYYSICSIIRDVCRVLIDRHYEKKKRAELDKKANACWRELEVENQIARDRISDLRRLKTECGSLLKEMNECYRKSFVAMQLEPEDSDENDAQ